MGEPLHPKYVGGKWKLSEEEYIIKVVRNLLTDVRFQNTTQLFKAVATEVAREHGSSRSPMAYYNYWTKSLRGLANLDETAILKENREKAKYGGTQHRTQSAVEPSPVEHTVTDRNEQNDSHIPSSHSGTEPVPYELEPARYTLRSSQPVITSSSGPAEGFGSTFAPTSNRKGNSGDVSRATQNLTRTLDNHATTGLGLARALDNVAMTGQGHHTSTQSRTPQQHASPHLELGSELPHRELRKRQRVSSAAGLQNNPSQSTASSNQSAAPTVFSTPGGGAPSTVTEATNQIESMQPKRRGTSQQRHGMKATFSVQPQLPMSRHVPVEPFVSGQHQGFTPPLHPMNRPQIPLQYPFGVPQQAGTVHQASMPQQFINQQPLAWHPLLHPDIQPPVSQTARNNEATADDSLEALQAELKETQLRREIMEQQLKEQELKRKIRELEKKRP